MHATSEHQADSNEWASPVWAEYDEEPGGRRPGKVTMWIAAIVLLASVAVAVQRTVMARADTRSDRPAAGEPASTSGDVPGAVKSAGVVGVVAAPAIAATTGVTTTVGVDTTQAMVPPTATTVAVTPTLGSVAVLAVIVVIRTFLSWSLELEISGRWPPRSGRRPVHAARQWHGRSR